MTTAGLNAGTGLCNVHSPSQQLTGEDVDCNAHIVQIVVDDGYKNSKPFCQRGRAIMNS